MLVLIAVRPGSLHKLLRYARKRQNILLASLRTSPQIVGNIINHLASTLLAQSKNATRVDLASGAQALLSGLLLIPLLIRYSREKESAKK